MRAMILAAGYGKRMREKTQHTPKPLLKVGGRYLIEYALDRLKQAGILDVVINISYHGEQIKNALGSGSAHGLHLAYSEEATPLETGGGIFNALPLLGEAPFLVMSCDVITDFNLAALARALQDDHLAHLVLVPNPPYHAVGDFCLSDGKITTNTPPQYTFGNISVLHPLLFESCQPGIFPLRDILMSAILKRRVTGELHRGIWHNLGTPEDLKQLERSPTL